MAYAQEDRVRFINRRDEVAEKVASWWEISAHQ